MTGMVIENAHQRWDMLSIQLQVRILPREQTTIKIIKMKVINTYIVKYKESYSPKELAILFELENGTYIIKYEWSECERIETIDGKIAMSLIESSKTNNALRS